jgi:hypothetical protein
MGPVRDGDILCGGRLHIDQASDCYRRRRICLETLSNGATSSADQCTRIRTDNLSTRIIR